MGRAPSYGGWGGLLDCFDIDLTSIHNFSAVIRKKYFSSKEVPPFHLGGVMSVIVNTLGEVELQTTKNIFLEIASKKY